MRAAIVLLAAALSNSTEAQFTRVPNAPASAQLLSGKGSIEGSVINELTREPVKKVQVTLSGMVNLTAVTGVSGQFAFKQLPSGQYTLGAYASNFPTPRFSFRLPFRRQITLAADEQKGGVVLSLIPGASINGRLVDEDGAPMTGCSVIAMQLDHIQALPVLATRSNANSNDKGEYRLSNLSSGKYYVLARCHQTLPLPHPFIRRGSGAEIPTLAYAPQFYPGAPDLEGATKVMAAAGTELTGIDFRMSPAAGVTVRGHVSASDPAALERNVHLMLQPLQPRDSLRREWLQDSVRFHKPSGSFQFQNVRPGSYEIIVYTLGDGPSYYARIPVEVGSSAPEPLEVMLAPGPALSGTVAFDGDEKIPFENLRVTLNALGSPFPGQMPNGQVQKDGSFTLAGVVPGRWRVFVAGAPGYIKSISLGEQEVAASVVDLSAGFSGPLKIVMGAKWAQVEGTVSGAPSEAGQVWGLLWPVEADRQQTGLERNFNLDPQGRFRLAGIAPGRYYACAVAVAEPWMFLQNLMLLNAIKSRCETLELTDGGDASVQIPFIPAHDLERMAEDLYN